MNNRKIVAKIITVLLSGAFTIMTSASLTLADKLPRINEAATEAAEEAVNMTSALTDPLNGWNVYDELIGEIYAETDMAKRAELMHQAEDLLMSTQCIVPIFYYDPGYNEEYGTFYLAFNAKSDLFADKTVEQAAAMREACSMLIDRQLISSYLADGADIANAFIPYGLSDGNGGVFKTDLYTEGYFDPRAVHLHGEATRQEARDLLISAGYIFDEDGMLSASTPLEINFLTNDNITVLAIAQVIQEDLGMIGINVYINSFPWEEMDTARSKGEYDLVREGWIVDYNDPINMLELFTTDSQYNDCQFGR